MNVASRTLTCGGSGVNPEATVIGGRYEPIRRIGSGGMADVFLGMDTVLRRRVAIKVLNAESAADPIFVERFRREAQAVAQLNQSNVVSVYDWGSLGGTYYMVMEYVQGETLKQRLRRGPLPEGEALEIAAEITTALETAHAHGIIHRDIKPQNVLLAESGDVKVADFGIAYTSEMTQLTRTHAVSGTAHYLSPEQAQGKGVDRRSDIYSLGVVLYEMLVGREPFGGSTLVEIAMRHIHEKPIPPIQLRPEITPATNALVLKALAKNPNHRFSSAADMRKAILEASEGTRLELKGAVERTTPAPLAAAAIRERPTRNEPTAGGRKASWLQRGLIAVPLIALLAVFGALGLGALHGGSPAGSRTTGTSRPARHTAARPRRAHAPPSENASRATAPSTPRTVPSATPTSAPAAAPPAPTATAVPPTPLPPTATPAAAGQTGRASLLAGGASGPAEAVREFYQSITNHDFNRATGLWTPAMQSNNSPGIYINQRFIDTIWIRVQNLSVSQTGPDSANVSVQLLEKKPGGPPLPLSGTWQVIKTSTGWQLNSESFSQSGSDSGN